MIVGIDYSLTCPAVCLLADDETFENSQIHYLYDSEKYTGKYGNIRGHLPKLYKSEMQRYENIAAWAMRCIGNLTDVKVFIEDYSMGSKGRVFHIAENCAILKYMLYKCEVYYETVPPTVIKKFATDKGNADKEAMFEHFKKETGIDLKDQITPEKKLGNPVTDIIDSYYIARYGKWSSTKAESN